MRVASLALLVACSGGPPSPVTPATPASMSKPVTPPDPHAAITARERADQALHEDAPLDYDRPFKTKPWDRSATARLFGDACRAGDKRACIIETQLVAQDERGDSFRSVLANCRAGDLLSCRALPPDAHGVRFPDAPGSMSRSEACQKPHVAAPCDVDALRRECSDGFPAACGELSSVEDLRPEDGKLLQRYPQLSLRGCRGGIESECESGTQYGTDADILDIAQRLCDLRRDWCGDLALAYRHSNDIAHEREALERGCQYGERWIDCAQVGAAYLDGRMDEPVPGRGQALLDWACPRIVARLHDATLRAAPGCARAHADMK